MYECPTRVRASTTLGASRSSLYKEHDKSHLQLENMAIRSSGSLVHSLFLSWFGGCHWLVRCAQKQSCYLVPCVFCMAMWSIKWVPRPLEVGLCSLVLNAFGIGFLTFLSQNIKTRIQIQIIVLWYHDFSLSSVTHMWEN
jgi:hypothetical protein